MARVLMVGIDPDQVDYSDPSLPPGLDAETIRKGIAHGRDDLVAAGHEASHLYIPSDPGDLDELTLRLAQHPVDCVIVGGGVRIPPRNLALFEAVLNIVAAASPAPAIALVSRPDDAAAAAARVLAMTGRV